MPENWFFGIFLLLTFRINKPINIQDIVVYTSGRVEMNVVAHNLVAMNAQRQFSIVNTRQAKTTERLSSGYKINRAADDAAGLSISEKMRRQIRGLHQAAENIEEGIGYVQTADGALNEAHEILQRMNELAVKSANGTNTDEDREFIDCEVQQLKEELDRIFETTTFNERRIWEITGDKKLLGTEPKQAVTSTTSSRNIELTNDNYDVIAHGSYKINANDQGIHISWNAYNGKSYQTKNVDWDTLEENGYSFDMSQYFDKQSNPELYGANGKPVFQKRISFNVQEPATRDDIIAAVNGTTMSSGKSASMSVRFENADGSSKTNGVTTAGTSLNYGAAYASRANGTNGRDFDASDDIFFEPTGGSGTANLISYPSATTVDDAKNSTEGWTFSFELDGVGTVLGKSVAVRYASGDRDAEDEGTWWEWHRYTSQGVEHKYQTGIGRKLDGGTLGNVMDALTGDKSSSTPGLLASDKGGVTDNGGYIDIEFDLTAVNAFTYADQTSNDVGSFTLRINVENSDTEETILNKINQSLNNTTILDLYSTSASSDYAYMGGFTAKNHKIDVPIWGGACEFFVQAGVEANQHINIIYDSLSLLELGLEDTNVLTVNDCDKAIDDIKEAIREVSLQRSNFGAYQNRLEHAYKSNKNVEENTTASESSIRDTDMAETMVEYSNQNILIQAGQAMMAQANQSRQGILSLLN